MSRSAVRRALLAVAVVTLGAGAAAPVGATTEPVPGDAAPTATIAARWLEPTPDQGWEQENPYIDCDSLAVRRPGCGSKDRGGWRQTLVFGAVLAGLVLVGSRVVSAARKRPTGTDESTSTDPASTDPESKEQQ